MSLRDIGRRRLEDDSRTRPSCVLILLVVVLLPALVAGCAHFLDSGIEGEVWIGPLIPVVGEGRQGDDTKPYAAFIRVRSITDGEVLAEVASDDNGRFKVLLAPGRYIVEPQQGDPLSSATSQEVTVEPGAFTAVRIDYDSGIR